MPCGQPISTISVSLPNELANRSVSLTQRLLIGQEHDAKMLRSRLLTEAGTVHDHDVLLTNEFLDEAFIVLGNPAVRNINPRESVERSARSNATHARCCFTPLLRKIAARTQFALHFDQMVLRTFERRLDGILLRMIRAQPRAQQAVNAFRIRLHRRRVAGDDAPTNAPSRNQIVLRHPPKSDARHIRRNRRECDMRSSIENELVVDFVREYNQTMPPCDFGHLLQHLPRA